MNPADTPPDESSDPSSDLSSDRAIVVGYDGSAEALAALHWAVGEALQLHAHLSVVACIDSRATDRDEAYPPLQPALDAADRFLSITSAESRLGDFRLSVVQDVPWIRLTAESAGSEMLVIGTSSHLLLGAWRLGAVTHELLQRASCPVMLVPREAPAQHYGRIVVAVDGTTSAAALTWAAQRAEDRACELVVVHASERAAEDPGPAPGRVLDDACRHAEGLTRQRVIPRLVEGPITESLLAQRFDSDLLVLGTGGGHRAGPHSGSIARAIAARATGPTVMLRETLPPVPSAP